MESSRELWAEFEGFFFVLFFQLCLVQAPKQVLRKGFLAQGRTFTGRKGRRFILRTHLLLLPSTGWRPCGFRHLQFPPFSFPLFRAQTPPLPLQLGPWGRPSPFQDRGSPEASPRGGASPAESSAGWACSPRSPARRAAACLSPRLAPGQAPTVMSEPLGQARARCPRRPPIVPRGGHGRARGRQGRAAPSSLARAQALKGLRPLPAASR